MLSGSSAIFFASLGAIDLLSGNLDVQHNERG